jgi:hypothetical protein
MIARTVRRSPLWAKRRLRKSAVRRLLDNLFFAKGEGIQFDQEAVNILNAAQPGVTGIDAYAVFGVDAVGQANGLRGRFLAIDGKPAARFIAWLTDRAQRIGARQSRRGPYGVPGIRAEAP